MDLIDGADVSHLDGAERFRAYRSKGEYSPGNWFRKHTGKGHKYTRGVQAFGIGLHAQSEWSETVDIKWTFGKNPHNHVLFGTDKAETLRDAETIYAW